MPYIDQERRRVLANQWHNVGIQRPHTPGELNYLFTRMVQNYIEIKGLSYQTINDILGALEGTKLEFYRRVAVPYEQTKIEENGDVY